MRRWIMRGPLSYLYLAFNSVRIIRTIAAVREVLVTPSPPRRVDRALEYDATAEAPRTRLAPPGLRVTNRDTRAATAGAKSTSETVRRFRRHGTAALPCQIEEGALNLEVPS
jgi:hypothetical protein